jgi:hypothetical protein
MVTITFFMVSFSFSAFFLDIIEEDYNTDTPLAFHPLKSAFAACSCDFIFFWLGLQVVWAIAPWIRVPALASTRAFSSDSGDFGSGSGI